MDSSSAASSADPSAPGPRRLASTRLRTPCSLAKCLATRLPNPLVPPVTSTVPEPNGLTV